MADMMDDKGKGSGLLLALSKSPPSAMSSQAPSDEMEQDGPDTAEVPPELESGAEEVLQAMQVGDGAGLARALQSFVTMCI